MSTLDLITDAGQRMTEAADAYHGKIADIDARVATKEGEVDAFIDTARGKLIKPKELYYDHAVAYSKTSLAIAADPDDNSRSQWAAIGDGSSSSVYISSASELAVIYFAQIYTFDPGYYETPQYSNDYSRTVFQFILAQSALTSAQINAAMADSQINPALLGNWSGYPFSYQIPIVTIGDGALGCKLFVRLLNLVPSAANKAE